MAQSQTEVAVVPTVADSWTDLAEIQVPAGVASLSKLLISLAADMGAAGTVRIAPVIRLLGAGIAEQSPHEYIAPCGNAVLGVSGAGVLELPSQIYDVGLNVHTGGTITVQCNSLDEVITAGTVGIGLMYSTETAESGNHQAQYIDAAMTTTADLWSTLGNITIPRMDDATSPSAIKRITIACATDQAALALLRCHQRIRLTGAGIAEGGDHEFIGVVSGTMAATPGVLTYSNQVVHYDVDIPINAGGVILVEQLMDVETPTAGTAIVGFEYK